MDSTLLKYIGIFILGIIIGGIIMYFINSYKTNKPDTQLIDMTMPKQDTNHEIKTVRFQNPESTEIYYDEPEEEPNHPEEEPNQPEVELNHSEVEPNTKLNQDEKPVEDEIPIEPVESTTESPTENIISEND